MFFFADNRTPVLFQGITSMMGRYQTEKALAYGTNVVAGVGSEISGKLNGIPLYRSVAQAVRAKHPKISVVFSTPEKALKDVLEAIKAKIPFIICTTQHVPMHDALKMKLAAQKAKITLLGPSSAGVLAVNSALTGTMPTPLFEKGNIAIIGRSASLMFEAAGQLSACGLGVSKCISLGADHLIGTDFIPVMQALYADEATKAILVVGQVHGTLEQELAAFYAKKHTKKLFVYIPGKALARSDKAPLLGMKSVLFSDVIDEKKKLLTKATAIWIDAPDKIGQVLSERVKGKKK
ncbi:MAG: hypothetical protein ACI4OR_04525 [Alphaproteobacteria bacterium]